MPAREGHDRLDKSVGALFVLFAMLTLATALFHLLGSLNPELRPGYPWQRHVFWAFANMVFCWFLLKRSIYFVPVLALLTLQQIYSHGGAFLRVWSELNQLSFVDLAVVLVMPIMLIAYIYDRRRGLGF